MKKHKYRYKGMSIKNEPLYQCQNCGKLSNSRKKDIVEYLCQYDQNISQSCVVFLNSYQSNETRRNYELDLIRYFDFLYNVKGYNPTSPKDAVSLSKYNNYRNYLIKKYPSKVNIGMPSTSVKRYLAGVKGWYRSLVNQGYIDKSPVKELRQVKTGISKPVNAFKDSEIKKCFKHLSEIYSEELRSGNKKLAKKAFRNIILFRILYETGGRSNAIRSIRLCDINYQTKRIFLVNKGYFIHEQQMGNVTMDLIEMYVERYMKRYPEDTLLFKSDMTDGKLTSDTLRHFVTKIAHDAGVKRRVSPHSFRSTLITRLHEQGIPLIGIADYMGIKNVSTVERYLRNRSDLDVNKLCSIEGVFDNTRNAKSESKLSEIPVS